MSSSTRFEGFRTVLTDLVPSLSEDEWAAVERGVTPARLSAGEPLVNEGQACRRVAYIRQGAFVYFTLRDGHKNVTGFDFEGDIAGDLQSFFEARPAAKNVVALEDSDVLMLTQQQFKTLVDGNPAFKHIRLAMAERLFEGAQSRAVEMQTYSAEERYRRLLQRSPHVIQRVPLYLIASYIGITPEALSRIRSRIAR
ncbi:hypothetical protein CRI93_10770 [Longimonas halophila]|uniref:Cyclic nucleotide-binding domain-containing protein n=1 Tax=Longimonas halophila TaxID=1469170 RepID=A0A2H3NKC4_9BACT|nr:Crp/Fnr family transcriptional regulator [Longimonas halophila]PEN06295.1 hypothetical protein CRI93_10770 [Longimonas halophila]